MVTQRFLAVAAGLAADRLVGEPPGVVHPVALFGAVMAGVERRAYAPRRVNGAAYAAIGLAVGSAAGAVVRSPALASFVAVAGRMLGQSAQAVGGALEAGDLETARALLPGLVGRDPQGLGEGELSRAVVESVAENTVDAVIAPAVWAVLGGAPGALGYRAVNTMDAMVGHRSDRYRLFGTAAARLDDVANWVPARLTAGLVMVVRPRRAARVWRTVRADAAAHPSPNAGVAEAAFAAALGLGLGGPNRYGERIEHRPRLGEGPLPGRRDIAEAVRLSRHCTVALGAGLVTAALLLGAVGRGRR